ncbi:TetR/AcrR family transcriptional regulator [Nocardia cyriacigeorgica]|uniref:TetR/AcrR family transcriptional regulator n=1 Tax=Nocardia cyriacigeorgica TaxID=135487 RepID=UPI0018960FAF|nr:TetR/AcrR family transcriptional regulator [Nocardia cyriacigeorgica]MBF6089719.1 TetR/AcrR family transcriptional regulator [Nocardia cyriacigeorgica]MBF6160661.1 TetR/AcrR family transcriptional regulator [Nocardia cyriacigeorgica]MBF6199572.1 TetR/AcrR family transcriptional regulator [Nocardia cyriacigeorgica]MBF6320129.1 TetR/AcrR family transcriptional regulator [Nocardia cyriacigeorgica]MBF6346750.1 TetR/AcrR family transcriptional regulator [Nocardia cyriacigeorgica]
MRDLSDTPVSATDGQPRRRRLEPDERRAQILAQAIEMFGERPYAAVSTAELAQRAGVARGLINHYFGNKRDLYLAVVRRMVTLPRVDDMIVPTGTERERVEASVSWLLDTISEHGSTWVKVTSHEGVGDDPEVQQILDQADDAAAERLLLMIGLADSAHSASLRAMVRAYGGLVKVAGREWITRGTLSRDQVHGLLVDMLLTLVTESLPKVERGH